MSEPKLRYFEQEDILHLSIADDVEAGSIEISPNITVELNDRGELIGLEIIRASCYLRDSIMETAQAKLLDLRDAESA